MNNSTESNSMLKARTNTHVSPLIWKIFVSSFLLFIGSFFMTTWTSTGPIWFSLHTLNSTLTKIKEEIITPKAIADNPKRPSNPIEKR